MSYDINLDNVCMLLEKFVGISGSTLQLINTYFSDRTQRVVIDGILTFHATAHLIHAWITTRLDFLNNILYNLPNNKIERLQGYKTKQHVC